MLTCEVKAVGLFIDSEGENMENIVIVIPSLEPDKKLLTLLETIRAKQPITIPIVIVDDGSRSSFENTFQIAKDKFDCVIIKHEQNFGKGRALKTAMNYVLENFGSAKGIVTIDSDGQHQYKDMVICVDAFNVYSDALIMGVRSFDGKVPLRSKFGNLLTRKIMKATTGINLVDTQTGLRVIPRFFIENLVNIPGERFEYEMSMLLEAKKQNVMIVEVPIKTIYIEENQSSHFHAFFDSIAIYAVFMRYLFSSVVSFFIDISLFSLIIYFIGESNFQTIILASYIARSISSLFNYLVNNYIVFKTSSSNSLIKYYSLVIVQTFVSSLLVSMVHNMLMNFSPTILKVVIDLLLFLISFYVQKKWVFHKVVK